MRPCARASSNRNFVTGSIPSAPVVGRSLAVGRAVSPPIASDQPQTAIPMLTHRKNISAGLYCQCLALDEKPEGVPMSLFFHIVVRAMLRVHRDLRGVRYAYDAPSSAQIQGEAPLANRSKSTA